MDPGRDLRVRHWRDGETLIYLGRDHRGRHRRQGESQRGPGKPREDVKKGEGGMQRGQGRRQGRRGETRKGQEQVKEEEEGM